MQLQSPQALDVEYKGAHEIKQAFTQFRYTATYRELNIRAASNFEEACSAFNTMFTMLEAGGGIVRHDTDVLFIKRFGLWDLPKGKLNTNEPATDGALREVTEETGLTDLSISRQLPSTFHIYTSPKGVDVLKKTYWFEMKCTRPSPLLPQTEEGITEVRWFPFSDIAIPISHTYASLQNLLNEYLR